MKAVASWLTGRVPWILSRVTFGAGLLLLASGATPSLQSRVRWLDQALPLGVIELSHFLSAITGVTLILVARAIHQRLDAAWHLVIVALFIGIATSLLKGLAYEEALALSGVTALVIPARRHFWRRAAVLSEPLTHGWIAAIAAALAGMAWLGISSYTHVRYASRLWWQFDAGGDAPRFLRAVAGAGITAMAFAIARWMRPLPHRPGSLNEEQRERLEAILATNARLGAHLALLGDKDVIIDDGGKGFLMYAVSGQSWIALGDPVGEPETRRELAWRFRALARRHGGSPVFYEVSADMLGIYADLGMRTVKFGEEARVSLAGFSLDVPAMRKFRSTVRQFERAGIRAELIPPKDVPALLPALREVSDEWLEGKRQREKGFSVGRFDEAYLSRFPIVVVRREDEILAFANLWTFPARRELSVDLMRYRPGRMNGIMDYLFVEAMRIGAREGFLWFNLGMAPLSGLEGHGDAPLWSRMGALAYAHGEAFYHFQGLRRYKEKFSPVWEPRYLAVPSTLSLPGSLANVTLLVSGGLGGLLRR